MSCWSATEGTVLRIRVTLARFLHNSHHRTKLVVTFAPWEFVFI